MLRILGLIEFIHHLVISREKALWLGIGVWCLMPIVIILWTQTLLMSFAFSSVREKVVASLRRICGSILLKHARVLLSPWDSLVKEFKYFVFELVVGLLYIYFAAFLFILFQYHWIHKIPISLYLSLIYDFDMLCVLKEPHRTV